MGSPGPAPSVTPEDALEAFDRLDRPGTPLTASEVAEELNCTRRTAHRKLQNLADRGDLQTKKPGAHSRVWWRPVATQPSDTTNSNLRAPREEFVDFVTAVEDYAIFTLDPDGTVATWNEGARRIKGYDESEIVGEHFSLFYTEEATEEGVPAHNLATAAQAGRVEDEGWRVRADGSRFWANVVITAIRDDEGDLQGFTKVTRDMTDRREYERQLERERRRTQEVLETAPIPIAVEDADGETVMANERAQASLGLSEEEIVEGPDLAEEWTVYDADGDELDNEDLPPARVRATGEPVYDEEIAIESPAGERTWFALNAAPYSGPDDEEAVVVAGEDVTALKERQQELETELSEIFGRVSDAFYALDEEFRFSHVNERAAAIMERSVEKLLGREFWEVFPELKEGVYREKFQHALETQESVRFQVYESGLDAWLQFTVYPSESGLSIYFQDVTDRKQRERELERYEKIVETMNDGIYVKDQDGRFTMVNDAYAEMTGYDPEELVGAHASLVVDEDTIQQSRGVIADEPDEPTLEAALETADGNHIPAEGTFATLDSGEEVGVVRDITRRKERERELERYRTIVETVDDGIYTVDDEGRFSTVNDAYVEMTGYDRDELLGGPVTMVVDAETAETARERKGDLLEGEDAPPLQAEMVTAGGERFPAEATFGLLPGDDDDRERVGVVRDVSERVEREQRLQERERQLSTLMDNVPGMVYRCRNERGWPMEFVSEGCREVTGIDPDVLERNEVSFGAHIVHEDDRTQLREEIDRGIEADGSFNVTYRIRRPNGDVRWVRERGRAIPDEDGEPRTLEGVIIDVTERKRAEQRLAEERDMFAEGPTITFRWEPDADAGWPVEYVSGNVEDVLGYTPEEFESGDVAYVDILLDEELERIAREVAEAIEGGRERFTHEPYRVRSKAGQIRWVKASTKIIRDEYGDVESYLGYLVDVTERMERERELEQSRNRYQALIDNFPNGAVALVDRDLRYQIVGGLPVDEGSDGPGDLAGEVVGEVVTPDLASVVEPRYSAALRGESSTFTYDHGHKVSWIRIFPVKDDDGEVFAAMGMSQDITEHVERERELEDAKSRLEAATEAGAIGTWEWNVPEDRFVANPSFARMFNVDPDAASEGVSIDRFTTAIHEDDRERVNRKIQDAVEGCGEYEAEYRVWNADGELRWVVARGHVECDSDGNPVTFPGAITDVTERKEYQRRIEESERRYRTLVENFPDGAVGLFDEDLRYTAAGGQYLEQHNISPESRIGESVYDLYPDELVSEVEPYFKAALDGEQHSFEVERQGRNLFAHTLPVTDAEGDVIAGMLVIQDVTERRQAQRELRESEAKFRLLAENLEEIVWMTTPDAEEWIYLNPAFEDVWGIDREKLFDEPLSFLDAVHPDDRERVRERFSALPEEDFLEEFRIVKPDGDVRWIRARGGLVQDGDEEMVRVVGIGEDVTERIERERELERALDLLEKTERIADVGGWEIDVDSMDVFWSDHLFEIFGMDDDEEPPVEEALDMYHDEDQPIIEDALEEALDTGDPFDVEVRLWTVTGDLLWLRVQGEPETEDGDVVTLRGAAQDVTGRIERERRLETLVDELEESNERLERFAYVTSHDLQEPLRMISNYLQLLERRYRDDLDEDATEFIDFAVDGADRMREMINDLLAYSRLDTEAEPLEPTDTEDVVDTVLDDLQFRIEETGADVTVGDLPTVDADRQQLEMVFMNLLSNAIKYSGDDSPDIDIAAEQRDEDWVFTVDDEGIGIDPEYTDEIFQVFNRLHTNDEYPGTGIGLAMCKKIVRRHGGDIWVESKPGEGSRFYFTIPVDARVEDPLADTGREITDLEGR